MYHLHGKALTTARTWISVKIENSDEFKAIMEGAERFVNALFQDFILTRNHAVFLRLLNTESRLIDAMSILDGIAEVDYISNKAATRILVTMKNEYTRFLDSYQNASDSKFVKISKFMVSGVAERECLRAEKEYWTTYFVNDLKEQLEYADTYDAVFDLFGNLVSIAEDEISSTTEETDD